MPRKWTFSPLAFLAALLLLFLCLSVVRAGDVAKKTKSWTIYHRILAPGNSVANKSSDWTVRGTAELTVDPEAEKSVTLAIANGENSLTEAFAQELTSAGNGWYQVKLKDSSSATEIFTSVLACQVRRANFRDEVVLQLQQGSATALSVAYIPLVSPLAPETCEEYTSLPAGDLKFESRISWETAVPGMAVGKPPPKDPVVPLPIIKPPPGLTWIPGAVPRKPNAGGVFVDPENPAAEAGLFGFMKRYWYIVVPLILMNVLSAGGESSPAEGRAASDEAATGAVSGGSAAGVVAGGAAAGAAVAGPAAASGSGGPVRRRGKRG